MILTRLLPGTVVLGMLVACQGLSDATLDDRWAHLKSRSQVIQDRIDGRLEEIRKQSDIASEAERIRHARPYEDLLISLHSANSAAAIAWSLRDNAALDRYLVYLDDTERLLGRWHRR